MLGSIFLLTGSWVLGISIVRWLSLKTWLSETLALIYILGTTAGIWLSFLVVATVGYEWVTPIFCVVTATSWLHRQWFIDQKKALARWQPTRATFSLLLCVLVLLCLLTPLFASRMLQVKNGALWSGGSTWGDLALHTTFIRQFARQETFDLTSPIYSQTKTNYPFLLNLYAGLLFRGGLPLRVSLMLTGWSLVIASCVLWFTALFRLTGKTRAGWVSLCLFFANGGFGFIYAYQDYLKSQLPFLTFIFHQTKNYTHLEQDGIYWSNVIVDIFLPQRTFIAGFMLFIVCMWIFMYASLHPKMYHRTWVIAGVLTALTPLLHTHTFLTLTGVLVCLTGYSLWRRILHWKEVFIKGLFFLAFTLPQYVWQTAHTATTQSFIATHFGWYTAPGQSVAIFWVENMGVGVFLSVVSCLWLLCTIKKHTALKLCLLALHLLFLIANVLQFQPFLFDNMKFMVFSYFAVASVIGIMIATLPFSKAMVLWVCIPVAMLSGLLAILRESTTHWQMASAADLQTARDLAPRLQPQAIVLTADTHIHPVPFLIGNPVVMGYRGWLWSHGFDFSQTQDDVATIFAGGSHAQELLQKYNVGYVYISPLERTQYNIEESFFASHYARIYQSQDISVYQVTR